MNDLHNKEILQLLVELRDLVLLAIPEARLPRGLKRPNLDKPSLGGTDLESLSGAALQARRDALALSVLDYLVGLDTTQRHARKYPSVISAYVPRFLLPAHDMDVDPPLYPVTYLSTFANSLSMRTGFKQFPRKVIDDTIRSLEDAGKIRIMPLKETHHKSDSDTLVVMHTRDVPFVMMLRDGPSFTVADVRRAIENGTEWWLDGGDPWAGPKEQARSWASAVPAPGSIAEGWAALEEEEEKEEEDEPVPTKKKPVAAPGSWAVGGG